MVYTIFQRRNSQGAPEIPCEFSGESKPVT